MPGAAGHYIWTGCFAIAAFVVGWAYLGRGRLPRRWNNGNLGLLDARAPVAGIADVALRAAVLAIAATNRLGKVDK